MPSTIMAVAAHPGDALFTMGAAVFFAGLASLAREQPSHAVGKPFFAENWEDMTNFQADTYLDISPVFDRWVEACSEFPM